MVCTGKVLGRCCHRNSLQARAFPRTCSGSIILHYYQVLYFVYGRARYCRSPVVISPVCQVGVIHSTDPLGAVSESAAVRQIPSGTSMYGMGWLVKTLMLVSMALGSVRPIPAFVPPPVAHVRRRSLGVFLLQEQLCMPLSVQPSRSRAGCGLLRCTSSATASSDAAREDEPWPVELSTESFLTSYPNQQLTATSSAVQVRGEEKEAFMFTAKPLPAGTILRGMQKSDVDGVVGL